MSVKWQITILKISCPKSKQRLTLNFIVHHHWLVKNNNFHAGSLLCGLANDFTPLMSLSLFFDCRLIKARHFGIIKWNCNSISLWKNVRFKFSFYFFFFIVDCHWNANLFVLHSVGFYWCLVRRCQLFRSWNWKCFLIFLSWKTAQTIEWRHKSSL